MGVYVGNTSVNTAISSSTFSKNGANGQIIPSGTLMTFQQTSSPTGFTKVTTYNDYAMRIVSGSVANKTDGVAFTTAFTSQSVSGTVGSTTLDTSMIPSHNHVFRWRFDPPVTGSRYDNYPGGELSRAGMNPSGSYDCSTPAGTAVVPTGGGGSHNHSFSGSSMNLAVNYIDFILAQAN